MEILVILALVLMNGAFAMSEMALVSARRHRLEQMARDGNRGAAVALDLLTDPVGFLSTVQIGLSSITIGTGVFGGEAFGADAAGMLATVPFLAPIADKLGAAIVVVCITFVSLILGELVPKRIALRHADVIAAATARPMRLLARISSPAVWLLRTTTETVLRFLGVRGERTNVVTEEEVRSLISEGTRAGIFVPREQELLDGVLKLADRTARSIMTPRPDLVWVNLNDSQEQQQLAIQRSGYSRFLVCRGDIDNLVGVVQTKNMLDALFRTGAFDLMKCLDKPLVVHEGISVLRLLDVFKSSPLHIAVVVDEYGTVQGVVAVTDIVEALAGDLPADGSEAEPALVRLEDGSLLVDGMMPIDDFEAQVGLSSLRDAGDFETVAGFVLWQLGHLPTTGEAFSWNGIRFEVMDMDGRRIDKLRVISPASSGSGTP